MDKNRFINLNTFEITDNVPGYIMADKDIVKTIAILNKKGYKTKASCSGHYNHFAKSLIRNTDIELLEETENSPLWTVEEVRKDSFDYWTEHSMTSIYVSFDRKYDFLNLPENFKIESDYGYVIRCTIELFDSNNQRKNDQEILNEIEKYNSILENWAEELPVLERKED